MSDLFLRNRRREYRRLPERDHDLRAEVLLDGQWFAATVLDTSASGIGLELPSDTPWVGPDHRVELRVDARSLARPAQTLATVRFARAGSGSNTPMRLGLEVEAEDLESFYAQISPSLVGQFNRRAVHRLDVSVQRLELEVRARGLVGRAWLRDLSIYGLGLVGPSTLPVAAVGERVVVRGQVPGYAPIITLVTHARHVTRDGTQQRLGLAIDQRETPDAAATEAALAMFAIRMQRGG